MLHRFPHVLAALVAGCVLAACSSSGGDSGSPPTATNVPSTPQTEVEMSTPEPPQPKPDDQDLLTAVGKRDVEAVARLIRQGANLNAQDTQGRTPAMLATYNKDVATARALIEAGADVNIRDAMLNNPFLYAGAENLLEILRLTIAAGANPSILNRFGGTALIPAGEHGHIEVIRELLTRTSIDVDHVNNLGWTALLEAIILNNGNARQQEAVRLLIEHGADVNLADRGGVTPLRHARERGFTEIAAILRAAGARE